MSVKSFMSRMSKRKFELERGSVSKKIAYGSWKDGLKRSMQDPTLVLKSENLTVTIRDKFPKVNIVYSSISSDTLQLIHQTMGIYRSFSKTDLDCFDD